MNTKNVELEHVCGITSKIPETDLPQIAFCGRSNVGKSSLINLLLERKSLARTSSSPGKTQTINFYNIDNTLHFVDLPGYGYAKVPESVKEKWGKMIDRYLRGSKLLKCAFLLVDIRHDPSKLDVQMYDWLKGYGINTVIIATKSDKLKRSQLQAHEKNIRTVLGLSKDVKIIPISSLTKSGRDDVIGLIDSLIENN